jgi:hypothetical protein
MCIVDSTHSSLEAHYKMQNNCFLPGFPKMTKYCLMRECDNILCGYLYDGDLVLSHQDGFYDFEFPKRFLEISSRDLTLFSILII